MVHANCRKGKSLIEVLVVVGLIALMLCMFLGAASMLHRAVQNLAK